MTKPLQTDFSTQYAAAAYDEGARKRKARKVIAILRDAVGDLSAKCLLDIGCSTGFMTKEYAACFNQTIGGRLCAVHGCWGYRRMGGQQLRGTAIGYRQH